MVVAGESVVVDLVSGDFVVVVDDFVAVSGLAHVAAVVEDLVAVCGVGQGGNLVLVFSVVVVSVSVSDDVVVLASKVVVVFGW